VRLVTWNVNSLRARLPRVEEFLAYASADVVCLQETKLADAQFPFERFEALGYEAAHFGNGPWNGVAVLSRVGIADVRRGFVDEDPDEAAECRLIEATCAGVRVASVYVPNGRALGSEQFAAKLEFLDRLRRHVLVTPAPGGERVLAGDFNVAPADIDVFDPAAFEGATHVTPEERTALARLEEAGLVDVFRRLYAGIPGLYTWWDYRGGAFHRGQGMRIDLVLASEPLAARATWAIVDRQARRGQGGPRQPSDHAPVVVDFSR
jgi:exodeoxyribonuclease-3